MIPFENFFRRPENIHNRYINYIINCTTHMNTDNPLANHTIRTHESICHKPHRIKLLQRQWLILCKILTSPAHFVACKNYNFKKNYDCSTLFECNSASLLDNVRKLYLIQACTRSALFINSNNNIINTY